MLAFVQFPHPGGEHTPDHATTKYWNRGMHKRKFVKHTGRYTTGAGDGLYEADLSFWCEWEPESEVIQTIDQPLPRGPRYVYEPYYCLPESYEGLQNTDPVVFGDRFFYTWCKQKTAHGSRTTQLAYLGAGSVILFGSCLGQTFVLDTVFVVDRWIDHHRGNYKNVLKGKIPASYADITIAPGYQTRWPGGKACGGSWLDESPADDGGCNPPSVLPNRLYVGAMYDQPFEGMFSFFPCLPYNESERGFERPRIAIPEIITDRLAMGFRLNPQSSLEQTKALWDEVVQQVTKQGLMLGVWAAMPERRDSPGLEPIHKENLRGFHC